MPFQGTHPSYLQDSCPSLRRCRNLHPSPTVQFRLAQRRHLVDMGPPATAQRSRLGARIFQRAWPSHQDGLSFHSRGWKMITCPCQPILRFHNKACRTVKSRDPVGHPTKGGHLAARKVLWGVVPNPFSTTGLGPPRPRPGPRWPSENRTERRRPTQPRHSCRTGQAIGHIITSIQRRHHCPKMSPGRAAVGQSARGRRSATRVWPSGAGQREARLTRERVGRRRLKRPTATTTSRADGGFLFSDK